MRFVVERAVVWFAFVLVESAVVLLLTEEVVLMTAVVFLEVLLEVELEDEDEGTIVGAAAPIPRS